jgi:hypothetical protein
MVRASVRLAEGYVVQADSFKTTTENPALAKAYAWSIDMGVNKRRTDGGPRTTDGGRRTAEHFINT